MQGGRWDPGIKLEPATLALASGETFTGLGLCCKKPSAGEAVFNTSMTGYQEILTDPSYRGQLVCMTAPHVGIVGTNPNDEEADGPQAAAMIVRSLSGATSSWRAGGSLAGYFEKHGIACISEVDTRRLTQLLRDRGAVNGCIVSGTDAKRAVRLAKECRPMSGYDLASGAGTKRTRRWRQGAWLHDGDGFAEAAGKKPGVALLDCGAKRAIMRELAARGLAVSVLPYSTSAAAIQEGHAGLLVSNGPGDPAPLKKATRTVKALLGRGFPIFGICLGHQVLAQAAGARVRKMKFGHHGANHPVLERESGRVFISSQNHGFTVDGKGVPRDVRVTHVSLFDGSVQGFRHRKHPALGFQGHPEASPGPKELTILFDEFASLVHAHAKKS